MSMEERAGVYDENIWVKKTLSSGFGYLIQKNCLKVSEFHSFSTKTSLSPHLCQLHT